MIVVLGFNDGGRNARFVEQHAIGPRIAGSCVHLAPRDDAPVSERELFANLGGEIPSRPFDGGGYELGADVSLRECLLVHGALNLW